MGLFDIFTRAKRRDELLGEIAPLLTQTKTLTFTSDTSDISKNKLLTDINELTHKLITNHGNDAAIVTPVKTILKTLGNQGVPASHFIGIRSSAYNSYYDYKMHKKNDTGLLREIEQLIVSRLGADHDFETLTTIQKTSPYALTRQECSKIILDLAQIHSTNGDYKESLEKICIAFEYLQPKDQEKAINLIDENCLNIWTEIRDFDAINIYSDFFQYGTPKAIRYNMAHNFLTLYQPSEIEENAHREFVTRATQIYSNSEEPKLKNWAYERIDELANLVASKGDLDSSIKFRHKAMMGMTEASPLFSTALAAWDKDISNLEYPTEKFHKSINALHISTGWGFSYANPKLVTHILETANNLLPAIYQEKSHLGITVAIDALTEKYSWLSIQRPKSSNDDLAATVIINAYDMLNNDTPYNDRSKILHHVIELEKISQPTLHRAIRWWEYAIETNARENSLSILDDIQSTLKNITNDFYNNKKNSSVEFADLPDRLPVNQKIIFQGLLDSIPKFSPYLPRPRDQMEAATILIQYTKKDDPLHQDAISFYVDSYKTAKDMGEGIYMGQDALPYPIPKELKRLFADHAKDQKQPRTQQPKPLTPDEFSNIIK